MSEPKGTPKSRPQGVKPDLERRAEALKILKKRIDGALKNMDSSSAAQHNLSAKRIQRTSFSGQGSPFAEADDLFTKFTEVHDTLVLLSRTLRDQIDATSIAVKVADGGFDAIDEEEKRRYWEISRRAEVLEEQVRRHHKDGHDGHGHGHGDKDGGGAADQPKGKTRKTGT